MVKFFCKKLVILLSIFRTAFPHNEDYKLLSADSETLPAHSDRRTLNFKADGAVVLAPKPKFTLQTASANTTRQGIHFNGVAIGTSLLIKQKTRLTEASPKVLRRHQYKTSTIESPPKRTRRHSARKRQITFFPPTPSEPQTRIFCKNNRLKGTQIEYHPQPMRGDNVDQITPKKSLWVAVFLPFPSEWSYSNTNTSKENFDQKYDLGEDSLMSIWNGIIRSYTDVNSDINLLEDYDFCLEAVHTPCNTASGIRSLFTQMKRRPETLAMIGPSCNHVTRALAQTARWWNLIQMSFSVNDVALSNRDLYPTFTRTIPSLRAQFIAVVSVLQHYNWSVVDVIHSNSPSGFENFNSFLEVVASTGISIGTSTPYHPYNAGVLKGNGLDRLNETRNNVKIFLGASKDAFDMFCQIFLHYPNLKASRKVWILTGYVSDHWWKQSVQNCSSDDVRSAIQGHFLVDARSPNNMKNKTATQDFSNERTTVTSSLTSYAYDAVLSVATALDETIKMREINKIQNLNNSSQGNETFRTTFQSSFNFVQLSGISGNVSFKNGERIGTLTIRQFINESYAKIGNYEMITSQFVLNNRKVVWPGNRGPPLAAPETIFRIRYLSTYVMTGVVLMSFGGITLACGFLGFNFKHKEIRIIKMSSPNLNNVIATGCVIAYISLILMAIESKQVSPYIFDVLCKVRQFLPPCAFTLAFGTMFLKTWRVHAIFTNVTVKKQVIKDYKLFGILSIFLFVDVIILITWFAVDPMRRVVKNSTNEIWKEGGQYVIIPQNEFCTSDYTFIWMAIVCSYKGILLVFGLFLAWNTRHVALPTLNDSKYIGVSVYITVITCVIGPTTSFALKDYHDISYAITSVSILLCTTATLCLVFVPKVTALRRLGDRPDNSMQIRLHGLKSKERQPLRSLVSMTVSPFSGNMSGYPARSGTGESTIEDKQSSSTSEQNGLLANEDIVKKLKIEKTKLEKDFKKACELHERLEKTTLSPDSCYIQIMKESKPTHQSLSGI